MENKIQLTVFLIVSVCTSVCLGFYLIMDYYMDDDWPSAFGQACGDTLHDDCLYINSHLNTFGILNYGDNIECTVQLDAGKQFDARYKIDFNRFDLEHTTGCAGDFAEFYDTGLGNISQIGPIGRYCGDSDPNITCYPTQRYFVIKFKTDHNVGGKGFRIMATRTIPAPCPDDYFHCKAENRCIDGRLKCDGTPQCDDELDEDDCSFFEKFIGSIVALGVSGLVGIGFAVVLGCTGICVTICACTCCKKRCKRLCKCCNCSENGKSNKVGDSSTGPNAVKSVGI